MVAMKKIEVKSKKEPKARDLAIQTGAMVRLTVQHLVLTPGEYEVDGFNASGDPILKSEKGLVNVPLEKIEVIKSASKDKKSKPADKSTVEPAKKQPTLQQTFIKDDDKPFYIDPYGQMTINKIDTPLGKLAQRIIQAELDMRRLEEQMTEDEDVMMKEMKKDKVNKIRVLGHTIIYQPSRTTNEKLIIKDLE